jgi:hypothetical protein
VTIWKERKANYTVFFPQAGSGGAGIVMRATVSHDYMSLHLKDAAGTQREIRFDDAGHDELCGALAMLLKAKQAQYCEPLVEVYGEGVET